MRLPIACMTILVVLSTARNIKNTERQSSAEAAFQQIVSTYESNTRATFNDQCNETNVRIRREWGDIPPSDRRRYIEAVKCLGRQPPRTPTSYAPGVRNRHDDFDVSHITQWMNVHNSPILLAWHQEMMWQMETALREECGWTEGQPYWNYAKYAELPLSSNPIFDGSDTSLSGDGTPRRLDDGTVADDDCNCITTGPFADWVVNIGPLDTLCGNNPRRDGLGFNPRCITRNFDPSVLPEMTYEVLVETIMGHTDVTDFSTHIELSPSGIHINPHVFIGGLQSDIPGSSADHAFYLHHTGLEWIHQLWLAQDFAGRTGQLPQTEAYRAMREDRGWEMLPQPGLDTVMEFSPAFEGVRIGEGVRATGGRYCYVYQ